MWQFVAPFLIDKFLGDGDNPVDDYMGVGRNRYQSNPYQTYDVDWGGQGGAQAVGQAGLDRMQHAGSQGNWAQNQAQADRGPQAIENQTLADREAASRYGDQAGAMQLTREAAMGMAPSQAAYQLQAGLDRGLAQQSAVAGGARGSAGIAMAGSQAGAAGANMSQQAYTEAGRLAAQESADARALYGNLATQQRGQDQNRLGMGNQMSQYNASQNDQYRLGMGSLSQQANQNSLGWYNAAQNPYTQQANLDMAKQQLGAQSYDAAENRRAGVAQSNADAKAEQTNRLYGFVGNLMQQGGAAAAGAK
jgi:hypothetical protein